MTSPIRRAAAWPCLALLACCTMATSSHALDAAAASPSRADLVRALELAERGTEAEALRAAARLGDHPVRGYLEYARLRRHPERLDAAGLDRFLAAHGDIAMAPDLRRRWLIDRAERGRWAEFRRVHDGDAGNDVELACHALAAELAAGTDAAVLERAAALWLHGASRPDACDPAFAALERNRRITPDMRRERIRLALAEGNGSLARWLARGLPAAEAREVADWAAFVAAPDATAANWRASPGARAAAVRGLAGLARHDPGRAEDLLDRIAPRVDLPAADVGDLRRRIALWSAASYLPETAARMARVPAPAFDDQLHAWRVREAIARGDHAAARAAIAAMPAALRADSRWRYFDARLAEITGASGAREALAALAREPHYHGFLAADRVGAPYALCPVDVPDDAALRRRVAAEPRLARALALFDLDRRGWAEAEWRALAPTLSDDERRVAVALAAEAGWNDRIVFGLDGDGDAALYALRFPLYHEAHLRERARAQRIDPAWVAALIRAESVWTADVRSHANAHGLMQLLPSTGRALARQLGVAWGGTRTLYQPLANITLGTAYLRGMLERFGGSPVLATAAYNAGPSPVERWRAERPLEPVDLFIETIPYHETRDYVARVFAFSVIYDWRLDGRAVPLGERLAGRRSGALRDFACPAPGTQAP